MNTVEIPICDLSPGDRLVRDEIIEGSHVGRLLPYHYVRTERRVLRAFRRCDRYWTVLLEGYGTVTIKSNRTVLVNADRQTINHG